MRKFNVSLIFVFALTACSSGADAPPATKKVGKANPAAAYCLQAGGQRIPVQSPQGVRTECRLPNGEILDEWELWRRDHPAPHS